MHTPPSGLRDGLSGRADKQALVDWVFDRVADRYDLGNDLMSAGWHTRWKRRLVTLTDVQPGQRVLDIACGTGDISWMLADTAHEVVGTDINAAMLAVAERKRPPGCENVRFVEADAAALPFPDESFDVVTCVYAGRGFPDIPAVLREAHRVLKPGGRYWHLDFARPKNRTWDRVYRGYMLASGAVLGAVLHGSPRTYMYIPMSMRHYAGQDWLHRRMEDAGFETRTWTTRGEIMAFNLGVKAS
ncbi:MAG: demethylmenaquinone methyltransferase/2-methoxy-6-polyprenyl-1,4-benzoquinol methylase [Myxococcota bacterium]|jgi:demethylmenaquinone methyltransferase/2-methoxy-6-polyprenyl-1,4-benzoquinol methylase